MARKCQQRQWGRTGFGGVRGWGSTVETEETQASWEQYAPLVTAVAEGVSDPHKQAMVWEQRMVTLQQMGVSADNPIYRSAQARYEAALRAVSSDLEEEQSTREWRALGKAGIATGIVVGIGLIVAVGVLVSRTGAR